VPRGAAGRDEDEEDPVPVDRAALDDSIRRLQGAVPDDADVEAAVRSAVDVVEALCGCSGAGLLLVDGTGALRYVAASDDETARLLLAEEQAGTGPGHDAVAVADVVVAAGVVAAPVRVGGEVAGTLHVHGDAGVEWAPEAVEAVHCYARLVEVVLAPALQARYRSEVVAQLQYALDHRVVVERAVGYLMASGEGDARASFERLRQAARRSRRHVADLAAGLLEGESLDPA
jgi:hypothetical protein